MPPVGIRQTACAIRVHPEFDKPIPVDDGVQPEFDKVIPVDVRARPVAVRGRPEFDKAIPVDVGAQPVDVRLRPVADSIDASYWSHPDFFRRPAHIWRADASNAFQGT